LAGRDRRARRNGISIDAARALKKIRLRALVVLKPADLIAI
jgi:hypothetical protein